MDNPSPRCYQAPRMKKSVKLKTPEFTGDNYYCFGPQKVVVLDGRYDARQLWLLFDDEAVFYRHLPVDEPDEKRTAPHSDPSFKNTLAKGLKRKLQPPQHCQQPYFPEEGVHQYILPIDKWQVPSKSLARKISKAGYPCFERDEEGEVYRLRHHSGMANASNQPLREWLNRNCAGRVIVDGTVVFERADDALFALVSGNFSKS